MCGGEEEGEVGVWRGGGGGGGGRCVEERGRCMCPTDDCKMTSPKTLQQLLLFTADNTRTD